MTTATACESCGMPIETGRYCGYCTDETGNLQSFDERFERMTAWQARRDPGASRQQNVIKHPEVIACLKRGLEAHNKASGGSSSLRVARAMLMAEPPSIDGNELTDKGYINQRAGLERRAALVDRLYAETPGEDVIVLQ